MFPLTPNILKRMADIVTDTQAQIIITSKTNQAIGQNLVPEAGVLVVNGSTISSMNDNHQLPAISSEDVAYILFTSGSTGKPKGVITCDRSLCSSMYAHAKGTGIKRNSRAFQFAAYTFDAMVAEIFTILIHGCCVCVPSEEDRMNNPVSFINQMINWVMLTPTFLRLLTPDLIPTVKTVVMVGEAVRKDHIDTWCDRWNCSTATGPQRHALSV